MVSESEQRKLIAPLFISLLLHLGLLKALEFLPKNLISYDSSKVVKKSKPLEVRSITREELKKYRTVGVKNGKKNFSMPTKKKGLGDATDTPGKAIKIQTTPKIAKKIKKKPIKKTIKAEKEISLNSLRVKPKDEVGVKINTKIRKLEEEKTSKLEITTNKQEIYQRRKEVQTDVLKQLAASPDNAKVLRKTGFNMQLEPPDGVSEDELNSMEKIFYSFQKRTFRTYVGSFLRKYQQTLLSKPIVKETIKNEKHRLAGRVIFDKDGNIISIKIIRSSHSDEIHEMFEETLKDMYKLPNPPKDLLSKKGQFTIYYQLRIN